MTITPETISKLIFHISNLRYYEKEYAGDKEKDEKIRVAILKLRSEIDKLLEEIGCDGYFALETLTEIVKIHLESNKLK
jgi:hypothetical protein